MHLNKSQFEINGVERQNLFMCASIYKCMCVSTRENKNVSLTVVKY